MMLYEAGVGKNILNPFSKNGRPEGKDRQL